MDRVFLNRSIAALTAVLLVLWVAVGVTHVQAGNETYSLTIVAVTEDDVVLDGMEWSVYCVGYVSDDGEIVLSGEFANLPIAIEDTSAATLTDVSATLASYVRINGYTAFYTGTTDKNGYVTIAGLQDYVYLFVGTTVEMDGVYYAPSPFLLTPASYDASEFIATAKYSTLNQGGGAWDYELMKIWANDTGAQYMRTDIAVAIYQDGVLFETITLNEANEWYYAWSSDTYHEWTVVEVEVPTPYTVTYRSSATEFVIINSMSDQDLEIYSTEPTTLDDSEDASDGDDDSSQDTTGATEPTEADSDSETGSGSSDSDSSKEEGDSSDEQDSESTGDRDEDSSSSNDTDSSDDEQEEDSDTSSNDGDDSSDDEDSSTEEDTDTTSGSTDSDDSSSEDTTTTIETVTSSKLPQTGQLWWPVPILAVTGMLLTAIGLRMRVKE